MQTSETTTTIANTVESAIFEGSNYVCLLLHTNLQKTTTINNDPQIRNRAKKWFNSTNIRPLMKQMTKVMQTQGKRGKDKGNSNK